ncbi:MAG: hypothetical protein ACRDWV_01740 [Acidimicrobiales bacterium]
MANRSRTVKTLTKPDNKALRGLGVLGLLGIGAAHLELWLGFYHRIPTIGPLFLFTLIFAWVLALVMIAYPKALVAVVAALFALATLGGYVLALVLPKGIFLFTEQYISYAGGVAIASEAIGAAALLAWTAARVLGGRKPTPEPTGYSSSRSLPKRKPAGQPWSLEPASGPWGDGRRPATRPASGSGFQNGLARLFFGHT